MKPRNDQHDEILNDFFHDLKTQDKQLDIPDFSLLVQKRHNKPNWLLRVAATVALLLGIWLIYESRDTPQSTYIEMSMGEQAISTESLATKEVSMYDWQSPTQSLISDF